MVNYVGLFNRTPNFFKIFVLKVPVRLNNGKISHFDVWDFELKYKNAQSLVTRRRDLAVMFDYPEQDFRHQFEMILEGARQLDLAKTTLQVRPPPSSHLISCLSLLLFLSSPLKLHTPPPPPISLPRPPPLRAETPFSVPWPTPVRFRRIWASRIRTRQSGSFSLLLKVLSRLTNACNMEFWQRTFCPGKIYL